MSSGQSLRNGNSVEPGLPNTFRIPNARNRLSVACFTLTDASVLVAGLRDNGVSLGLLEMSHPSLRGAKRRSNPSSAALSVAMDCFAEPVIGRAFARPVGSQ